MNLTLAIIVGGRKEFSAPYYPENMNETAREIHENWETICGGKRAIVVVRHENVFHIITASNHAA